MKRILALSLLFVTCLLCLLSCKGCNPDDGRVLPQPEASVTYIGAVLQASRPTKAAASVTYVLADGTTLTGRSTLQVQEISGVVRAKFAYEYQVLAPADAEEMIQTVSDTVYSSGNRIANFLPTGGYQFEAYTAQTTLSDLTLPEGASVSETDGTYRLVMKVAAADADATFGVALGAVGDVTLTLSVRDDTVVSAEVKYDTARGTMTVVTEYTYNEETFSFSKPQ